ncbi:NAD(P)-binding protein [Lizonia empirigonia]|nr:NAD(P)-binding protein [Lizonia empirigonia]
MVIKVAIAGGTAPQLGRAIVTGIQDYPDQLQAIVLTGPSSKIPPWLEKLNMEIRRVDYMSEPSLVEALEDVHTVISTVGVDNWVEVQKNLLNASVRAGVKGFAPSKFAAGVNAAKRNDVLRPTYEVMDACRDAQRNYPGLEIGGFHAGLFMNYLEAVHRIAREWPVIWDMKNMEAKIPLSPEGNVPRLSLTEIGDVGRFTAAACLLPKGAWKEEFNFVGETISMDEFTKLIEKVRRTRMDVIYRPFRQIVEEEAKETVNWASKFWLQAKLVHALDKAGEGVLEPVHNELVPQVQPISVEEYVRKYWSER